MSDVAEPAVTLRPKPDRRRTPRWTMLPSPAAASAACDCAPINAGAAVMALGQSTAAQPHEGC